MRIYSYIIFCLILFIQPAFAIDSENGSTYNGPTYNGPTYNGPDYNGSGSDFNTFEANFGLANFGVTNFELSNFGVTNFDLANFGVTNFDLANFGVTNFDLANFGVTNLYEPNAYGANEPGFNGSGWQGFGWENDGLANPEENSAPSPEPSPVENYGTQGMEETGLEELYEETESSADPDFLYSEDEEIAVSGYGYIELKNGTNLDIILHGLPQELKAPLVEGQKFELPNYCVSIHGVLHCLLLDS